MYHFLRAILLTLDSLKQSAVQSRQKILLFSEAFVNYPMTKDYVRDYGSLIGS